MFNKTTFNFIKKYVLILFICCFSCKDEVVLNFSETILLDETETIIEINIPKAEGKTKAAKQINAILTNFACNALNIGVKDTKESIEESVVDFKKMYSDFKTQIGKALYTNLPTWEVLIDGEVLYKSETLICIAMNSSINTGGVHSNLVFKFYNFNAETGEELHTKDLINDIPSFTAMAKKYYERELLSAAENRATAFNSDTFKLPENLGFNDEGVILFYDTFNTATNNIVEFTIPYVKSDPFLNF